MTVTKDATSNYYVPATAAEWVELLANTGISAPQFLWLCQEASGNLADSIGACTMTVSSTPGYQATVTGWARKALTFAGGTDRFENTTTPPDGGTSSLAMFGYFYVTSAAAAHHAMMGMTNFAITVCHNNGVFECIDNVVGTGAETISDSVVRPCMVVYNRAKSTCKLYYRRVAGGCVEVVNGTYASSSGVHSAIGGYPSIASMIGGCLYACQWTGSAAEMSDTQAMLVLDLLALGPLAGRSISRDATSNYYVPANIGEWFMLLKGTGVNPPSLHFSMQDTSGALSTGLIDSVGAYNPGINTSVGNFQNAVTGWTRKGILMADGAGHIATVGNWPGGSSMALALASFPTPIPAARRSVLTFGGTYAAQVAFDVVASSSPTLPQLATHGDVNHDGTRGIAGVHTIIVQNNTTTQIGLIETDTIETISFAQTNADSMGALIIGGNNASTWFAAGVTYMLVVAWDAADAEQNAWQRAAVMDVMKNGPVGSRTISRDATSGWAVPANVGEWLALLNGAGINPPSSVWLCQEASGSLLDSVSGRTLAAAGSPAYQQAVTGWSRLSVQPRTSTGDSFGSSTAGVDQHSSSTMLLMVVRCNASTGAEGWFAFMGGGSTFQELAVLASGVATVDLNGGAADANGAISLTSRTVILALQVDITNTVARAFVNGQEIVTPTWQGVPAASSTNLFINGVTWPNAQVLYAGYWIGSDAEMDSTHANTLIRLMETAAWQFDMTHPPDPSRRLFRQLDRGGAFVPVVAAASPPPTGIAAQLVRFPERVPRAPTLAQRAPYESHNVSPLPNAAFDPRVGHAVFPDRVPARAPTVWRGLIAERMNVAPLGSPFVPTLGGQPETPDNPPRGQPRTAHRAQSFALGPLPQGSPPPIQGRGPSGTPIVVIVEDGAQVTWSWGTDVIPARDGSEHRIATTDCPRDSYAFTAWLTDATSQNIQSSLIRRAAKAQVFLLGNMAEASTIVATSSGTVLTVATTQYMDWIYPGSRITVLNEATGVSQTAVVQSSNANQIVVDFAMTVAAGDLVMPLVSCYMDSAQKLGAYAVNAARFDLVAHSFLYGDASSNWTVHGASLTNYTNPSAVTLPVFTGGNEANSLVGRALMTGAELIDYGGAITQFGPMLASNVARELRYTIRTDADRQWLKLFAGTVRGRQGEFYLPSWRADFTIVSTSFSNQVITYNSTTDYAGQWSTTGAHNQVQLIDSTGSISYRTIVASTDNGDGTQTMQLDSTVAGTIIAISFLERCRLDSDDVVVTWAKSVGTTNLQAIVTRQ